MRKQLLGIVHVLSDARRLPESPWGVHVLNAKPDSDGRIVVRGGEESETFCFPRVYLANPPKPTFIGYGAVRVVALGNTSWPSGLIK